MNSTKATWQRIFSQVKASWPSLLLTHLIFTALGIIVFAPLIGLTSRLLLKLSGQNALADQEIAYFLLSPLGMAALIIFAALFIAILSFEQAAMMRIFASASRGQRVRSIDAIIYTLTRAHKLWLFTARLVIRILMIALPLLALAAAIAWYLISDYDINFYLTEKPREFLIAAALIGIIVLTLIYILTKKLMQWSMTLPLIMFDDTPARTAFTESEQLVSGHKKRLLVLLISWAGLSLLPGIIALTTIKLLGKWSLPMAGDSLSLALLLLGTLMMLWVIMSFLIATIASASLASLITVTYRQFRPDDQASSSTRAQPGMKVLPQFTPKVIVAGIIGAALVAGIGGVWLLNGIPTVNHTLIVAHRGAAGKAPENTLASFEQAIKDQTDWIELDVQEDADGTVVVMHDSDFMKLSGEPIKTWDTTADTRKDLDIGGWYDPAFSDQRVPTLQQVLELARGKVKVVIELKYYGYDQQLEQAVIDIVEQMDMVNEVAIMSLKYAGIQKVRTLRPDWNIGLLSATAIGDLSRLDTNFLAVAMGMATPGFIQRAHKAGRKVFVWTVNDSISMSRMMSLGVDGLITDEPELARKVIAQRAQMTTLERLLIHTAQLFGKPYTPKQYRDNSP